MAIDYAAIAAAGGFGKGESRAAHKAAKHAAARKADDAARTAAWARCHGRCEAKGCRTRLTRSGDLLHGAHFHHVSGRLGVADYQVLCYEHHIGQGHRRGRR